MKVHLNHLYKYNMQYIKVRLGKRARARPLCMGSHDAKVGIHIITCDSSNESAISRGCCENM